MGLDRKQYLPEDNPVQPPTGDRYVHTFGDESSHRGDHYVVYGTISCNAAKLEEVTERLAFPKFAHEFSWRRSGFYDDHKRFVDEIFRLKKLRWLIFRCIVIKASHMKKYKQNDSDLSLERAIYRQLLRYAIKQPDSVFHVVLDEGREKRFPPQKKQQMLNDGYLKETGLQRAPFLSVRTMSSYDSRFLQAADVLSGAVGWVRNKRYDDKDQGPKKGPLARYIATKANLPAANAHAKARGIKMGDYLTLDYGTSEIVDRNGFAIWDFDITAGERRKQEEISAAQIALIPGPDTRWKDLPSKGFRVRLACAYCENSVRNFLLDQKFADLRLTGKYRPTCGACGRKRVPIIGPDPRKEGVLLARLNAAQ